MLQQADALVILHVLATLTVLATQGEQKFRQVNAASKEEHHKKRDAPAPPWL